MATTTNYGWTTPDDTSLVKDGAAAIRSLGTSVDTTVKALNPETTLGDISYRSSTANTNTRLAIGTTGQVLTVSGGVPAWASPSAGATLNAQKVSAYYYRTQTPSTISSNVNANNYFQATYYMPIYLPTGTADRLVIRTSGTYSGTATVRIGLYNDSNGLPTTVLVDGGTVSATAANTVYSITISQAITAGWYWMATNATDSGGTNTYAGFDFSSIFAVNGFLGARSDSTVSGRIPCAYYQTGVTGAFATAGTLNSLEVTAIAGMVRIS